MEKTNFTKISNEFIDNSKNFNIENNNESVLVIHLFRNVINYKFSNSTFTERATFSEPTLIKTKKRLEKGNLITNNQIGNLTSSYTLNNILSTIRNPMINFTIIPNEFIDYSKFIGVKTSNEFFLLIQLMRNKDEFRIKPSLLAERMNIKEETVKSIIKRLIKLGLIERVSFSNSGSVFKLDNLYIELEKIKSGEIKVIEKKEERQIKITENNIKLDEIKEIYFKAIENFKIDYKEIALIYKDKLKKAISVTNKLTSYNFNSKLNGGYFTNRNIELFKQTFNEEVSDSMINNILSLDFINKDDKEIECFPALQYILSGYNSKLKKERGFLEMNYETKKQKKINDKLRLQITETKKEIESDYDYFLTLTSEYESEVDNEDYYNFFADTNVILKEKIDCIEPQIPTIGNDRISISYKSGFNNMNTSKSYLTEGDLINRTKFNYSLKEVVIEEEKNIYDMWVD